MFFSETLALILYIFRSNIEENNSKLLAKLAKQAGSCCVHGTFAPIWNVLKTSAEKLSALHIQMVQKVTDLVKEVSKYADELHKKHKQVPNIQNHIYTYLCYFTSNFKYMSHKF